ncbi:ABC transporter, substrate-binding protein YnjB, partial [hydrothermal vent metagenome]
ANAKAAAMVVANFLMSPEAQARKSDEAIWGDPTVLAIDKLNVEQLSFFDSLAPGAATLSAEEFGAILSEPDASWSDALDAEWARRYGAGN